MLAAGGSALYLSSVLIAGFGYGYKAAFLLPVVPLVSVMLRARHRVIASSGLAVLLLGRAPHAGTPLAWNLGWRLWVRRMHLREFGRGLWSPVWRPE